MHNFLNYKYNYYPFGSSTPGRLFTSSSYRYGFNSKEKDGETVSTSGGTYDFGARIYNPALGRWLSLDPMMTKYPNLSPYNFSENNPIFFNDPDGRDAIGTISGNNITIKAVIYVNNAGDNKINIADAQKSVMQYWGKDFKYTDESGKEYNVKFDITVKEVSPTKGSNPVDEGTNYVRPMDKNYRSNVKGHGGWYGRWASKQKDATYAHEVGHMLGLADQYTDVEYDAGNLDLGGNNGKVESWDYASTAPNELMGTANGYEGKEEVSQRDVNEIAKFVLANQKDGKTVINSKTLIKGGKGTGLSAPTVDDKVKMEEKAGRNYRKTVEPHKEKIKG